MKRRTLFLAAAALSLPSVSIPRAALAQTCGERTAPQTEGPFFTPKSPERASLLEPDAKHRFVLSGSVLSPQCRPVARALVDLWHADEAGDYDNRGYRYRGHVFTDAQGRYRFETVVPARYTGRTRHYHVKVQAPGRSILTTQLYFPGEPANARDGLYRKSLEMEVAKPGEGRFDFVVEA